MATEVEFVVALLSLACCPAPAAGQGLSASFHETWGYYTRLASSKPIDWNTTVHLKNGAQVQQPCYNQSVQLHTDMAAGMAYAIHMLDSSGKFNPTALFEGQYDDFGSFKGCRDRVKDAPDLPAGMKPMYCTVSWSGIAPELAEGAQWFTQGLCVPNTCSNDEVGLLANTGLLGMKPMRSWIAVDVLCQREEEYASFDTGAVVAICVIAIILLLLFVGTLYEFIINISYTEEKVTSIGKTGRFFLSFSVYSNTKKVFDTYQPPGQLPALHGIRIISALWIIYGHTDFFFAFKINIITNIREKNEWSSQWWYFIQGSMDMAVDAFLLLSALLVSYVFMKQLKKNGGSFTGKDLLLHFLHRYWRLTPVYAFLIMIFACLMVYMGTGPVWASPTNRAMGNVQACQTWIWTNLLYINNWFSGDKECYFVGWYLGVDMQLYVLAPALLLLLYKKPKLGVGLVTFLIVASMFIMGILFHFLVDAPSVWSYYDTVYKYTPTRMGPYMVGLLMGYVLFRTDSKVPNTGRTKALMLLGWFGATAVAVLFVAAPGWIGSPFSLHGQPVWRAFDRTMFSCAVAWVVFACCVGYGGIVTEFLSWSGWIPLSRLTYTVYLVHPIVMFVYMMSLKTPMFYSAANWWFYFIAYSFLAFLCGFAASIMVEFPFFGLEKLIFRQRRGRDSSKASHNMTNEAHDNQAIELGEKSQPFDDRAAKSTGQLAMNNDIDNIIPGPAIGQRAVSIPANQETFDQKL